VWVGFDDYQSLGAGAEGATTAVPIWMHYMKEALKNTPSARPPRPPGLIDLRISPRSGTLTSALNPEAITETFMVDHLPREPGPGEDSFGPAGEGTSAPLF